MIRFRFLIFVFAFFILNSCKEFQEVQVTGVKSFRLTKVNSEGIEGEVILGVKNPNEKGFSIYPSEFDVVYSGINLGKARLYKRVHIDGKSEKLYTFNLKTSLKDVNLVDAMGLLGGGKMGNIEAKGNLKVGKFLIRKKVPVNISEKVGLGG